LLQFGLMLYSLWKWFWCLLFVIPGNLITYPLTVVINYQTELERIKALKNSNVKIKANDVAASYKIFAYICAFPLYLGFFTLIFNRFCRYYLELDRVDAFSYSTLFFILFPITSLIAIRSHDGVVTHFTEFHGRFSSLFFSS